MRSFAWAVGFVVLTVVLAMARWAPPPDPVVVEAQRTLNRQGLYPGAAHGIFDRDTAAAVRRYQMLHEMQATGKLDRSTAARMKLPEYTPEIVAEDREFLRQLAPALPPVAEKSEEKK